MNAAPPSQSTVRGSADRDWITPICPRVRAKTAQEAGVGNRHADSHEFPSS